jgi:hypothetical protein
LLRNRFKRLARLDQGGGQHGILDDENRAECARECTHAK